MGTEDTIHHTSPEAKQEFERVNLSFRPLLQGKKAIVTGAGTGIGRGIALKLAAEGAELVLHYFNEDDGIKQALDNITDIGGKASSIKADFNDFSQVQQFATESVKRLGTVDILVNNAGITKNDPFLQATPEDFDLLFNVNVKAPFFITQAVSQSMVEQSQGIIVALSSIHAFRVYSEHSLYRMTKQATNALTEALAVELGPLGIRANAVAPGWCVVENHREILGEGFDFAEAAASGIPTGKAASPNEIGAAVVSICTDVFQHMNGHTLKLDGGMSLPHAGMGDVRRQHEGNDKFGRRYS